MDSDGCMLAWCSVLGVDRYRMACLISSNSESVIVGMGCLVDCKIDGALCATERRRRVLWCGMSMLGVCRGMSIFGVRCSMSISSS